jgi:hypothetical protein
VTAIALPSRRVDAAALRGRAHAVAIDLARELGGRLTDDAALPKLVDLSDKLGEARALAIGARFAEAVALFDATLADGTRRPGNLTDPAAFVTAHVTRASLALARGDAARADDLMARVQRWDPGLALLPSEDSPRMRATLDRVRSLAGAEPAVRPEDLGESCRDADVLVVARALAGGKIDLLRFDHCRPITPFTLAQAPPERRAIVAEVPLAPVREAPRPTHRPSLWPWVTAGGGVALVVTGALLADSVGADYEALQKGCGRTQSCVPAQYEDLALRNHVGWGLVAAGAAVTVTGLAWWIFDRGSPSRRAWIAPTRSGLVAHAQF